MASKDPQFQPTFSDGFEKLFLGSWIPMQLNRFVGRLAIRSAVAGLLLIGVWYGLRAMEITLPMGAMVTAAVFVIGVGTGADLFAKKTKN
jgi:hypothetical protein